MKLLQLSKSLLVSCVAGKSFNCGGCGILANARIEGVIDYKLAWRGRERVRLQSAEACLSVADR